MSFEKMSAALRGIAVTGTFAQLLRFHYGRLELIRGANRSPPKSPVQLPPLSREPF